VATLEGHSNSIFSVAFHSDRSGSQQLGHHGEVAELISISLFVFCFFRLVLKIKSENGD
jgi:hypothetical protein